jgi:hypothetical protein
MRAKAIRNKFEGCPPAIAAIGSPESQTHLSLGMEYEVFALSVFQGVVFLQVVVDVNHITWLPAWFFEVCEATMPHDWICSLPGESLQMVLGPKFVAADEASYNRMVELDSESVTAFWQRVDARARTDDER